MARKIETETLEDILADVPDLSTTEADDALRTAESVENFDDLESNLADAEQHLRELLREVQAMRKRVKRAKAAAEGDSVRDQDNDDSDD